MRKQLPLPLTDEIQVGWWRNPSIWKERHYASNISRPCEDEALDNIYYASKMIDISAISELSGLEQRIFMLELRSMLPSTLPIWYTPDERMAWIAKQANILIADVKGILDSVSYRLRISA